MADTTHAEVRAFETSTAQAEMSNPLLEVGDNIGGYVLDHNLGRGTFTETWRAHHGKTQEPATLKVFQDWLFHVDLLSNKLIHEAEVLKRISHPSIVPLLDYHFASRLGDRSFLVMPYIEGAPLHRWLHDRKPEPREIVKLFMPLLEGLDTMNRAGVLHLNIRPSNILVDKNGRPLITDSDLSGAFKLPRAVSPDVLEYSSPERLAGRVPTSASDVYSMACVLLKSLGGQPPSWVTDNHATAKCRIEMPDHATALSGGLGAIFEKSLSQDPSTRFQTCAELSQALQKWLEGKSNDVLDLSEPRRPNRAPAYIAIAGLLGVVIGGYTLVARSSARAMSKYTNAPASAAQQAPLNPSVIPPVTFDPAATPKKGSQQQQQQQRVGSTQQQQPQQAGAGKPQPASSCDQLELELPAVCKDADCRRKKETCQIPEL